MIVNHCSVRSNEHRIRLTGSRTTIYPASSERKGQGFNVFESLVDRLWSLVKSARLANGLSEGGSDIGMRKVLSLEQQRLIQGPGESVSEAISEVQP